MRVPKGLLPPARGFALAEVLVALFVAALGITGAAALQTLALRAGSEAVHLAEATRLAQSLAERMRANPAVLALDDGANPYLELDYAAGGASPAAAASCYGGADCTPDALVRLDLAEVSDALAAGLPGGRILVCRDGAVPSAAGAVPAWTCTHEATAPLVVKLGWRGPGETGAAAPKLILPLPLPAPGAAS
jgi:type IV pilus assembly protein PilV